MCYYSVYVWCILSDLYLHSLEDFSQQRLWHFSTLKLLWVSGYVYNGGRKEHILKAFKKNKKNIVKRVDDVYGCWQFVWFTSL